MNSGKIKFVYFDVGGVFFDWKNVFTTPAREIKVTAEDISDIFDENDEQITKGLITPEEFWGICRTELGVKEGEDYDFLKNWVSDYIPLREVYGLVKDTSKKYKVGLLSNIYKGMFDELIKEKMVPALNFDALIMSCDVGMKKLIKKFMK